jgi:hypothetical protein
MEFRRTSDRLNFFFDMHSWVLLVQTPNDASLDAVINSLRTVCKHWGSKLEFPFQLEEHAFVNNQDALNYWLQKLPGLRLLHNRKQEIIISELFHGYDPQKANQLLRRKLQLDAKAWAHLIHFGGPKNTFVCTFQTQSESFSFHEAIARYYNEHLSSAIVQNENPGVSASPFEMQHGLRDISSLSAGLLLEANNSNAVSKIVQTLRNQLDSIYVDHFHRSITFVEMNVKVRLSPQCFALYCMYLDVVDGMQNLYRDEHKHLAIAHYQRIVGRVDADRLRPIENCFNIGDDKPLRDAVNKIKRVIVNKLGSEEWAKPYLIRGENGQNKRISINRDLVSYAPLDLT